MIRSTRFRMSAPSLKRFGEALKRSALERKPGFARARAHPPIPPRGVRSSDAPWVSLVRALARALKRTSDERFLPGRIVS